MKKVWILITIDFIFFGYSLFLFLAYNPLRELVEKGAADLIREGSWADFKVIFDETYSNLALHNIFISIVMFSIVIYLGLICRKYVRAEELLKSKKAYSERCRMSE